MSLTHTAIEPVLPEQHLSALEELTSSVIEGAARLAGKVREPLRADLTELTRWMHCYYSNLIEGQQTRVRDIEAALKKDFAAEPKKRNPVDDNYFPERRQLETSNEDGCCLT